MNHNRRESDSGFADTIVVVEGMPPRSIEDRLAALEAQQVVQAKEMQNNTKMTQAIYEVIIAGRMGFKVIGGIGILVKWCGMVAGGAISIYVAIYMLTHGGSPPGWTHLTQSLPQVPK
jgi:hypothetical protein